jgi:hypothetical protein
MTTQAQQRQAEQDEARAELREMFPPGTTVPTILRHVSQSGMSRAISVIDPADAQDVSYLVARALGEKVDQRWGGIKVTGCGMDMGFHLVYALSSVLYRAGWACVGEGDPNRWGSRCPSNTHVNRGPDRDTYGPSVVHTDGYALQHRWL